MVRHTQREREREGKTQREKRERDGGDNEKRRIKIIVSWIKKKDKMARMKDLTAE